jgi:TolA-binding protein
VLGGTETFFCQYAYIKLSWPAVQAMRTRRSHRRLLGLKLTDDNDDMTPTSITSKIANLKEQIEETSKIDNLKKQITAKEFEISCKEQHQKNQEEQKVDTIDVLRQLLSLKNELSAL